LPDRRLGHRSRSRRIHENLLITIVFLKVQADAWA
jgi:hypothetical protein